MYAQNNAAFKPHKFVAVTIDEALGLIIAANATPSNDTSSLLSLGFDQRVSEVVVTYDSFESDRHRISVTDGRSVDLISVYVACAYVSIREGHRKIARIKHYYEDGVLSLCVAFKAGRPALRR